MSYKDIILRKLPHGLFLGHINLDPLRTSGKVLLKAKIKLRVLSHMFQTEEPYFLQSYFLQLLSQSVT